MFRASGRRSRMRGPSGRDDRGVMGAIVLRLDGDFDGQRKASFPEAAEIPTPLNEGAEVYILSIVFAVRKKMRRPVISTMVVSAGLATTAGSSLSFAAPSGRSAPMRVEVIT